MVSEFPATPLSPPNKETEENTNKSKSGLHTNVTNNMETTFKSFRTVDQSDT